VPVGVAAPGLDHGELRPRAGEQVGQARVGGAVVRDLEDLDRRRVERRHEVRLGVPGEEQVGLAVRREEDDRALVRVEPRQARVAGPEHAQPEAAEAERVARARDRDGDAPAPGGRQRVRVLRARSGEARVEHPPDVEAVEHAGGAADVVPLRVRQHEEREPADAEPAELGGDVRLRRPLVDEHGAFAHLQQDRVALADVEERDPQAAGRRRGRRGKPPARRHERDGGEEQREVPPLPATGAHEQRDGGEREHERADLAARRRQRARQAADRPSAPGEVRGEPAVRPGERDGRSRQERVQGRGRQPEPEQRPDDRRRERVRRHRVERHGAEVEPEQRRGGEAADARERDGRRHLRGQRVALEHAFHAGDGHEDRRDRDERELEAGLEQAPRVPRE
jgi:hypothetical protein